MLWPRLLRPRPLAGTVGALDPLPSVPVSLVSMVAGPAMGEVVARLIMERGDWDRCSWLRELPGERGALRQGLTESLSVRSGLSPLVRSATLAAAFHRSERGTVLVLEDDRGVRRLRPMLDELHDLATQTEVGVVICGGGAMLGRPPLVIDEHRLIDGTDLAANVARNAGIDEQTIDRVLRRRSNSGAILLDLAAAARRSSPDLIVRAVAGDRRLRPSPRRITRRLLDETDEDEREALAVAARTGYWHPRFSPGAIDADQLAPWVTPLEHGWGWVRPFWRTCLRRELDRRRAGRGASSTADVADTDVRTIADAAWRPMLDVRLLGPVEVRVDGRLLGDVSGQLAGSVLRYLLTRSTRSAHRDELIEVFWPEADPRRARNRLQVAVSSLRKIVKQVTEVELVEFRDGFYRISSDVDIIVDSEHFERLVDDVRRAARVGDHRRVVAAGQAAVGRYRGPLCPDLPFAEWAVVRREQLRLAYGDALDALVGSLWALGDYGACIAMARRILDEDPCREDVHRLIMTCQVELGHPHHALRQFEACRRILEATLGIAPSPATMAACRRVREGIEGYGSP